MKILISNYKENKDGSASFDLVYNKEVANFIKKHYNRKRITQKLMQKFVIEGLNHYLEKKK